jgi:hypothetical protein
MYKFYFCLSLNILKELTVFVSLINKDLFFLLHKPFQQLTLKINIREKDISELPNKCN